MLKKSNSLSSFFKGSDYQTHEHSLIESKKKSFSKSLTEKSKFTVDKFKRQKFKITSRKNSAKIIKKSESQKDFDFNLFMKHKDQIEEEINESINQKNVEIGELSSRIEILKSKINFLKNKEKLLGNYNMHSQLPESIVSKINIIKEENQVNLPEQITKLNNYIETNYEKYLSLKDENKKNVLLSECNKKDIKYLTAEINKYRILNKEEAKNLTMIKGELSKYTKLNMNLNFRNGLSDKKIYHQKISHQKELNKKFSNLIPFIK